MLAMTEESLDVKKWNEPIFIYHEIIQFLLTQIIFFKILNEIYYKLVHISVPIFELFYLRAHSFLLK